MEPEFYVALATIATLIMSGKVSLRRGLIVVFAIGTALIALNWAHTRIQGVEEIGQLKRRIEVLSELDLLGGGQPFVRGPLQSEMIEGAVDLSLSKPFVLPESSVATLEPNATMVVETVEPTMVTSPAKKLA